MTVFVYQAEECIDGEVTFTVKVCMKKETAIKLRNDSIEDLKSCLFAKSVYKDSDFEEAEKDKTDSYYFVHNDNNDYYLQIVINEEKVLE